MTNIAVPQVITENRENLYRLTVLLLLGTVVCLLVFKDDSKSFHESLVSLKRIASFLTEGEKNDTTGYS